MVLDHRKLSLELQQQKGSREHLMGLERLEVSKRGRLEPVQGGLTQSLSCQPTLQQPSSFQQRGRGKLKKVIHT
jgi:hypothetical protein